MHWLGLFLRRRERERRRRERQNQQEDTDARLTDSSKGQGPTRRVGGEGLATWAVLVPAAVIVIWGFAQAVVAGSIVGGLLGTVYEGGGFRMSTWIPLVYAGVCTLVLVLGSFSIQGGM